MSVVIWDGATLASDRGAWRLNLVNEATKLHVIKVDTLAGERRAVVGFVGDWVRGDGFCRAIKEQGYPLKEAPADGLTDMEALVLLVEQGETPSLYYHDASIRGAQIDVDAPFVIGNGAAAAAALALVTIADMTAQEAVQAMVAEGRFDAVAGGVDWCTVISEGEADLIPDPETEVYTPELDEKLAHDLAGEVLEIITNWEQAMEIASRIVALRNSHFGSPDHHSYSKLSEAADHITKFAAAFVSALDVHATGGEAP